MLLKLSVRSLAPSGHPVKEGIHNTEFSWTRSSLRAGVRSLLFQIPSTRCPGTQGRGAALNMLKNKLIAFDLPHFPFLVHPPLFFFPFSKIVNHIFSCFKQMYHRQLVESVQFSSYFFSTCSRYIYLSCIIFDIQHSFPASSFHSFLPWENYFSLSY